LHLIIRLTNMVVERLVRIRIASLRNADAMSESLAREESNVRIRTQYYRFGRPSRRCNLA
jgi:hypothetical protein